MEVKEFYRKYQRYCFRTGCPKCELTKKECMLLPNIPDPETIDHIIEIIEKGKSMKEGFYYLKRKDEDGIDSMTLVHGYNCKDRNGKFVFGFNTHDGGDLISIDDLTDDIEIVPVTIVENYDEILKRAYNAGATWKGSNEGWNDFKYRESLKSNNGKEAQPSDNKNV